MRRKRKLPHEKRMHLLQVYLEHGFEAAAPLAHRYDVHEKMISAIARENGHQGNHPKRKALYRKNYKDRRWQWAIERGSIIA